eukprot:TRINITY_DN813_c0_g1_i2.p1 TRINITY_DN813_c0_g1~~TRINITY_DN813_c0_g1_i2.p1  ORF type:complete len:205 (-),score=18.30 TRINITY_DN813_c0_g1_i2:241-855(-)
MAARWHKIVVLGSKSVGKSSFITRKQLNVFEETLNTRTRSMDYLETNHMYKGDMYKLRMYEHRYEGGDCEIPMFFMDADAAVILYSCEKRESCQKVNDWITKVRNNCQNERPIPIVICETHIDTFNKIETKFSNVEKQYNMYPDVVACIQTSAKFGTGIEEAFNHLVREIQRRENGQVIRTRSSSTMSQTEEPIPWICSCCFFY